MRGLAIGIALAVILVLVPAGHFLLVLVVPLAFLALMTLRTTWQPIATTYRPQATQLRRRQGGSEGR